MGADEISPGADCLTVVVMMDLSAPRNTVEEQCLTGMEGMPFCTSAGRKEIKMILFSEGVNTFVPRNRLAIVTSLFLSQW